MTTFAQRPLLSIACLVIAAHIAGTADAGQRTLASEVPTGDELVALDADVRPTTALTAARRQRATDFGIVHDAKAKKVYIYGMSGAENHAVVELVNTMIVGEVNLRVTLASGGVASGTSIVANIQYLQPSEATPTVDTDWLAPEPGTTLPEPPTAQPQIIEVRFQGRGEADYFENQTNIPSWAVGSAGDDTLIGGSNDDILEGGDGNDTLRGNDGADRLYGGFGNDDMFGGNGDDYITAVATGNAYDQNLYCGQDGADTLVGAPFSMNLMDAEIAGGVYSDGYEDRIEGTSGGSNYSIYEFTPDQDLLFENGVELEPGSWNYPTPDLINCG